MSVHRFSPRSACAYAVASLAVVALVIATPASGQSRRPTQSTRAESLYVSADPADHPQRDQAADAASKVRTDSIYAARSAGVMDFAKITYRSAAGDLDIPAYRFQPLRTRGPRGHAAMVWVHGGVHSNWGTSMFPFVQEAVERGYVVIAPDYRGSTGYGAAHYNAIDYGGKEVDDVFGAVAYLKSLPHVDGDRLGIMGWSHGGFITSHLLFRGETPFKAGAAIVPVTNLVFRLGYKGPGYQRSFSTQAGIRGLPHEQQEEYIKRSPLYQVENLRVPILVHVATNDEDVNYVEDQQMVWKLRALKPDLAETKIYVDPAPWGASIGHAFSRRVDSETLQRVDSPEQIDSWNRTWVFFEWHLRPYLDLSKPQPPLRTR
ncbi:MAG: prolyl oligopeptidase family serine peptidase [Gemmatimonadaceae bacterium]|nr:prolyl oligopeptidase family serine peptidase [Gemmatimonadaceae bacterium]